MQKRVYNLSRQENNDFCVPAVFQAIMRKYELELTQQQIAQEINFHPEKLVLLEQAKDFFKKKKLGLDVYYYDETPWNDHEILVLDAFENNQDLVVGYDRGNQRHHTHLALGVQFRQLIMQDSEDLSEISEDIYELERKMWGLQSGVYGLVRKL